MRLQGLVEENDSVRRMEGERKPDGRERKTMDVKKKIQCYTVDQLDNTGKQYQGNDKKTKGFCVAWPCFVLAFVCSQHGTGGCVSVSLFWYLLP